MRLRASLVPALAFAVLAIFAAPARSADGSAPVLFTRVSAPAALASATGGAGVLAVRLDPGVLASLRAAGGGRASLPLPDGSVELALRPSPVLAPDAVITTTDDRGEHRFAPDLTVLAGEVAGEPGSIVTLTISARGVTGVVIRGERRYSILPARVAGGDHAIGVDPGQPQHPFECPADQAPSDDAPRAPRTGIERTQAPFPSPTRLMCDVAVDCDYEYYANKFGSDSLAAASYVATVYATASQIYERDLNTTLRIVFLNLWTTVSDPWDQSVIQDQLDQFTGWCVAHRAGVSRNLAQLVSGRPLGGGYAWIHALCSIQKGYSVFQWDASYNFPTPSTTWDVMVTAHEIGHNFGSQHTQNCIWQQMGLAPVGALLDSCYAPEGTCYSGPTGIVPATRGTIMSYCHTLFPGMSNIRLEFHDACKRVMRDEAEVSCFAAATVQPPRKLVASALPIGNALQWLPSLSSGVLRYRVYRSGSPFDINPVLLDSTTSTTFVDPIGGSNYYKVKAVRVADASSWSNESRAVACAPTNPWSQTVGAGPVAMLTGRLDDDALYDLAVVNGDGASVSILRGQRITPSTSPFAQPPVTLTVGTHPTAIAAGDFERDGSLDLAVAIMDSNVVTTFRGSPGGSFTRTGSWPVGDKPHAVAVADVDEDGIQDLLVAVGGGPCQLAVLRGLGSAGTGNGTFAAPVLTNASSGPARGMATGDWNKDGILDVAVADSGATPTAGVVALLPGQGAGGRGNGTFGTATQILVPSGAQGIATGDFNDDGNTDLAIASPTANQVAILLGNGSGGFAAPVSYGVTGGPSSIVAGDWNQDGITDLATSNTAGGTIGLLFGHGSGGVGDGTFGVAYGSVGAAPGGIIALEFDDDGRPDLGIVNGTSGLVSEVPVACAGPYGASIDVTAPVSGVAWIAPSEHTLSWTRDAAVPEVTIELSRDAGATWQTIATHVTGTSWTWTVTEPYTNQAKIRISDATVPARTDTSSGLFTIVPQSQVAVAPGAPVELAIQRVVPNPSRDALTVWLTAPGNAPARLELLDVAGRRWRSVTVAARSAAPQPVFLSRGPALPSGVYLLRLTQQGRTTTARAVVAK